MAVNPHEIMIDVRQVSRRFRKTVAINDLSLAIKPGELFGIVGPDGTGKSTLLRMIAAVLDPTAGQITLGGHDSVRDAEAVKAMIGYMPQHFGLYSDLSVAENLNFTAELFGVTDEMFRERAATLYDFTQLADFKNRPAGLLSGGMKKKLALACALVHEPNVLLLDEPTTGVDPVARRDFWDLISGLHASGTTTVVSTPYMDEAERCNRVALLYQGRLLVCDTPANIKAAVPGDVLAIATAAMRDVRDAVADLPDLLDVQNYGKQINLIVSGDLDTVAYQVRARLDARSIPYDDVRPTPLRIEEAFIYLVKEADKERVA